MANTYIAIATVTVGSGGAASIDFNSIPSTYTDLLLVTSCRSNRSSSYRDLIQLRPNSATTNLSARALTNDGGSVSSGTATVINGGMATASSSTANTFGNSYCYIPNYAGSTNKSFSTDATTEDNSANIYQTLEAGLWSNTAAITSISLVPNVGTQFVQYSTATLYGIKNS